MLVRDYLPHAPALGLFVAPDIPPDRLSTALGAYGHGLRPPDVLALYDATRLGSGRDGALFLADRFVFQNNRLQEPVTIAYGDVVGVRVRRLVLGGRRLDVDVNRGRATITESMDFSARGEAAGYVKTLLEQAMLAPPSRSAEETDVAAVRAALEALHAEGRLSAPDLARLLGVLREL